MTDTVQLERWRGLVEDMDTDLRAATRLANIAQEAPKMLAEIERLHALEHAAREYREAEEVHKSILGSEARDLAWAGVKATRRKLDRLLKEGDK